jgi:hypothetical protein
LKRGARRVQMKECRIRRSTRQFDGLRDRQCRRRCGHGRARQSDNGTDGAEIIRLLIRIGARCRQLLRGLYRRRRLRCDRVEMAERKRKLDGERKQRRSRAKSDVRPDPLHADNAPLRRNPIYPHRLRRYNITSQARHPDVNRSQCLKTTFELEAAKAACWRSHGTSSASLAKPGRRECAEQQ